MVDSKFTASRRIVEFSFITVITFAMLFSATFILDHDSDSAIAGEAFASKTSGFKKTADVSTIAKIAGQAGTGSATLEPELSITNVVYTFGSASFSKVTTNYYLAEFNKNTAMWDYTPYYSVIQSTQDHNIEYVVTVKNVGQGSTNGGIAFDVTEVDNNGDTIGSISTQDPSVELVAGGSKDYTLSTIELNSVQYADAANDDVLDFDQEVIVSTYKSTGSSTGDTWTGDYETKSPQISHTETTNEYAVLTRDGNYIEGILNEGETKTFESPGIGSFEVELISVTETEAQFYIDGESTSKLESGEYDILDDGESIILATDLVYQDYAGGIHTAKFLISAGISDK